ARSFASRIDCGADEHTPRDTWRLAHFNSAELLQPGISDDNADPDADGVPNLLEYALGLEPKSNSVAGLPMPAITNSSLALIFTRQNAALDLTYIAEASADVTNWSSVATQSVLESNALSQIIEAVSDPTNRCMRLRVVR